MRMKTNQNEGAASLKKEFAEIVQEFDKEFKNNNLVYRVKYLELAQEVYGMYEEIAKCFRNLVHIKEKVDPEAVKRSTRESTENEQKLVNFPDHSEPSKFIEYSVHFSRFVYEFFTKTQKRIIDSESKILELFKMDKNHNYLQILAKINLENFQLVAKVEQLQNTISLLKKDIQVEKEKNNELNQRIHEYCRDYDKTVVSIAEILKKSEKNQIQLKQENRLQKELIQTQKIEFERYKADFKKKPSEEKKENKIREVLEKKFHERQKQIYKQAQKMAESKILNKY